MRIRRRNFAWLSVLATLIMLAIISGTAAPQVALVLMALFALALAASVLDIQSARLRESVVRTSPLTRMRMSVDAREAADRARRRASRSSGDLALLDIGLISSHSTNEGMVMRKSRAVSGDDDGVRPFITLYVQPAEAERSAVIRFEIIDQNGQAQYVHEMKTYLRDGEMNILADHHLPLINNESVGPAGGEWDLRVSVDSVLVGMLMFSVSPSLVQRERSLSRAEERRARLQDQPGEDAPKSLEELLRGQNHRDSRSQK